MIKNERQYRITQAQEKKFTEAAERLRSAAPDENTHPLLRKAEIESLESLRDELRVEIAEYEELKSKRNVPVPESLDDLPRVLIQARIASGLSQRQIASSLGLKEQQIQRYEATNYASASLQRVQSIARLLGVRLSQSDAEAA